MNVIKQLEKEELITPPKWLADNISYLVKTGSQAYGVSEDKSDLDIYGFCIPKKETIFPHLDGFIEGFGEKRDKFEQYQQHHVEYDSKNYDLSVYNIVKYFQLCADNNPNMIDTMYVKQDCLLVITKVGTMVRDNRDLFLTKNSYHRFRGYAFKQLAKVDAVKNDALIIKIREFEKTHGIPHETTFKEAKNQANFSQLSNWGWRQYLEIFENGMRQTKRFESQKIHNTDTKYLYHLARLMDEAEQILTLGTIDLTRSKEYLKSIRKGEVNEKDIRQLFDIKEKQLTKLYNESKLRYSPDWKLLNELLLNCLEEHYGNLKDCVVIKNREELAVREIKTVLEKYNL